MAGGGGNAEEGEFGLQIAPMLDVLFVLLLFFMVSAGAQKHEGELGIKLPSRGSMGGTVETPINIDINSEGQAFFNHTPIDTPKSKDMTALKAKLQDIIAKFGDKQSVIVTPERKTRHERVIDVLNACNYARVKNLSFGVPTQ